MNFLKVGRDWINLDQVAYIVDQPKGYKGKGPSRVIVYFSAAGSHGSGPRREPQLIRKSYKEADAEFLRKTLAAHC